MQQKRRAGTAVARQQRPAGTRLHKEEPLLRPEGARKDTDEIAKLIIAFSNFAGGKLVVDIEDDGDTTGFKRNGAHAIEDFKQVALEFKALEFVDACQDRVLRGKTGRGKTHLAIAVGIAAASAGRTVRFHTVA